MVSLESWGDSQIIVNYDIKKKKNLYFSIGMSVVTKKGLR